MRITILSRYSRLGASSRLRTMQYVPALEKAGFDVEVFSLFDDGYLQALYEGRRQHQVFHHYVRRVAQCFTARASDVLWVEKEVLPWCPWAVESRILPSGVPIVSDYDDALFHRYDMHSSELVRKLLGRKIDKVMAGSTLVTAGNAYIAERARGAGSACVEIVPTVVDAELYQPRRVAPAVGALRIGWIGTPQTWGKYGAPLMPLFSDLASQAGAKFRLVGASPQPKVEGAFEFVPWSEAGEVSAIQEMDIGIMPLADSPWERGKCGYKLIQYMACGLPVVATPVGVNSQIVEHGINGFHAVADREWRDGLSALLSNANLRAAMGSSGRVKVERQFSIQVQGPRVARMLKSVVERGRLVET
ncbi:MAG: glycosyltransferase family 4 protein [Pseudomonadota bacterium]